MEKMIRKTNPALMPLIQHICQCICIFPVEFYKALMLQVGNGNTDTEWTEAQMTNFNAIAAAVGA